MTTDSQDGPLEMIDRLLAGVVRLLYFAQGRPERASLERSWWVLRSLKHGAEAALTGVTAERRSLSRTGRAMLIAYCNAERSGVYRCAAHLGLVPRMGTRTWMLPGGDGSPMAPGGVVPPPPEGEGTGNILAPTGTTGQSLGILMGL